MLYLNCVCANVGPESIIQTLVLIQCYQIKNLISFKTGLFFCGILQQVETFESQVKIADLLHENYEHGKITACQD